MPFHMFAFALVGYAVVAALAEQYDKDHGTDHLTSYTIIIWLAFMLAKSSEIAAEAAKVRAALGGGK